MLDPEEPWVRAGHNLDPAVQRLCCASLFWADHAPSCRVTLDAKAAIAASRQTEEALSRVLAWCDEQDKLSKGESPTTAAVRAAIRG